MHKILHFKISPFFPDQHTCAYQGVRRFSENFACVLNESSVNNEGDEANFFSVSDQRSDLAIQDLRNFFVEKSSDSRPVNIIL